MSAADNPIAESRRLVEPAKQLAQIASLFCYWLAQHDAPLDQMAAAREALGLGLTTAIMADDDR